MSKWIWGVLIALNATPASALLCNPPNIAAAWADAALRGDDFILVRGRFAIGDLWDERPDMQAFDVPARFSGVIIHTDRSETPIGQPVHVVGECTTGDCGYVDRNVDLLTFLHRKDERWIAYSMPCDGFPLGVSQDAITELLNCMTDGPCTPERYIPGRRNP